MAKPFPGFSPKALTFFRQLKRNNSRQWFTPRKEIFEQFVRQPMLELVGQVVGKLREFAVEHVLPPQKAVYRIYRDTRFSKDKTPYKTHIAAIFPRARLSKHGGASYYFSVSDDAVEVAGGVYMPAPEELAILRGTIAADHQAFTALLGDRALRRVMGPLQGEKLARVPRGFAPDHPAAQFLRMKQLYLFDELPASLALKSALATEIVKRFRVMAPFVDYLNAPLLSSLLSQEDQGRPQRPPPMF